MPHWQTRFHSQGLSLGSVRITGPEKQPPEDAGRCARKSVKEAIGGPLIKCSAL